MSNLYQNSKIREQSAPLLFSQPRNQNQSITPTITYSITPNTQSGTHIYTGVNTYTHTLYLDARTYTHTLLVYICRYTLYIYKYTHTSSLPPSSAALLSTPVVPRWRTFCLDLNASRLSSASSPSSPSHLSSWLFSCVCVRERVCACV